MTTEDVDKILDVDKDAWTKELNGVDEFYAEFGDKLPKELEVELETLKSNLSE